MTTPAPASPPFPAAVAMAPAARTVKQREAHDALQHKANKRARKAAKQQEAAVAADGEGDDDAVAAAEAEEAAAVAAAAAATAEAELALMRAAEFGGDDDDDSDSDDSSSSDSDDSDVEMAPVAPEGGGEGEAATAAAADGDSDSDADDDDDDDAVDLHAQQRAAEEEARISRRAAGGGKGPAYFAAMAKQMADEEKEKAKAAAAAAAASKARAAATRSPRRGPAAPVPTNRATRIEPCDPTKIVQGERLLHCGVQREVISGDCKVALVLNSKGFPDWTNLPQGECAHILTKVVGADVSDDASLESFVWGKDSTTLIVVPHTHGIDLAKAALRVPTAKPPIKEGWVRAGVQNVPPHSSIFKTTLPMSTLRVLRAARNGSAPPPEDADEAAQRKADRAAMAAAATLPMTPSGADTPTAGAAATAAPTAAAATAAAPAAATSVTGSRKRKAPGGATAAAAAAAGGGGATGSNGAPSRLPLLSAAARSLVDRVIEPELRRRSLASGTPLESEFIAFFRATEETFNRNVPSEQPDPLAARIQAMWDRENKNADKDVGEFVKWQLARVMLLVDPASNRYLHELRNKCIVEDSANVDYSRCI